MSQLGKSIIGHIIGTGMGGGGTQHYCSMPMSILRGRLQTQHYLRVIVNSIHS